MFAVAAVLMAMSILLLPGPAPTASAAENSTGEPVDIAGVVVLRLRVPVDGLSPLEQKSIIYQRWVEILHEAKEDLSPDMVRIEDEDGVPVIYVGSVPFVAVDEDHARLSRTTPNGLAEVWAANLRRAITRYLEIHSP